MAMARISVIRDAAAALLVDVEGRVPDKFRPVYEPLLGAGVPVTFIHPDPAGAT
jgi:hypothetical protein